MSSTVLTFLVITTKLLARVSAQIVSNVTCFPDSAWMNNSKNQNPCLVGAYLQAQCTNGSYEVQPLFNLSRSYVPPGNGSDVCTCSTVTYSLMAACGLCQDAKALNWTAWHTNCLSSDIDVGGYPFDIPTETAVPAWAYLDVTVNNTFSPWAAYLDNNTIESTALQSTTSASSAASITATATPSATSATPSATQSPPSRFGAIVAGSAVGGFVAVVAIILTIAAYLNRYHRHQRTPSWDSGTESTGLIDGTPKSPRPMGHTNTLSTNTFSTNTFSIYSNPQDLSTPYDPWDPVTFSSSSSYSLQQAPASYSVS